MYYDLDKEINKIIAERKMNIHIICTLIALYIIYIVLKQIIPTIIVIFILLPIIIFAFILLTKKNKTDEEKVEELVTLLKKYNINTPDKINLLINQNQKRMYIPSVLNISVFLLSIVSIIVSLMENPKEQFNIIIIVIFEMIILGISYVMYYKMLSNYENYYKLNNLLCYIYINFEKYFLIENKKKSSNIKNILLCVTEKLFK